MPQVNLSNDMVAGGIVITVVAAFSLFVSLLTLLHILLAFVLPAYAKRMTSLQERNFLMTPLGFYIICLFTSNLISAMGGVMQTRWVHARAIIQGPTCSSQGFLLQLGNNATALWIGVISLSALRTFMFRARSLSRTAAPLLICALWTAMILFDTLASTFLANHSGDLFYGIAFVWCWITPNHRVARLITQYVWMWVWSLVGAVCFLLVFLSVRGDITMKRDGLGRGVKWSNRASGSDTLKLGDERYDTLVGAVGKIMCWFPICYITLTLPISVSRVLETFGFPTPVYAFVFSAVCFLLLGISFPILYFVICRSLRHDSRGISNTTTLFGAFGDALDEESFHNLKNKSLSPVSKVFPYPWSSTLSTGESAHPQHRQSISAREISSFSVVTGEGGIVYARRGSVALQRGSSLSFQLPAPVQPNHRPMNSISAVAGSSPVVPSQLSAVLKDQTSAKTMKSKLAFPPTAVVVQDQSPPKSNQYVKGADVPASKKPKAISPDFNALLLASQTPTSPSGPPPPPRKIKRVPISRVPVDVDESDQGSILSALPTAERFGPEDIQPIPRESPDSMGTFWAAYENSTPMSPQMSFPAKLALKRDTMRTFWTAYENPSPSIADIPLPSDIASLRPEIIADSSLASPDSFQFTRLDPSVSLKPSISAVGTPRTNVSPTPSNSVVGNHLRSSSSLTAAAPPLVVLHSDSTNLRSSSGATARLNVPYERGTVLSEASTNGSYRIPRFQAGYV